MDPINDIHHQSGWLSHHSHHESHRDTSWPLAVIWVIGSLRLMDDRDDHLESSGALVKRNLRKHSKCTRLFSSKQWLSIYLAIFISTLYDSYDVFFRIIKETSNIWVDDIKKFIFGWRTACQKRHLTFLHQWICVGRKPLRSVCWWEICMQYQHHQNGSIPLLPAPHWWMWWCSHGKTNSLTCMNYREEPSWI